MHNLYSSSTRAEANEPQILGRGLSQAIPRLDSLLLVLKSCQGITCIDPWSVLHPDASVRSLRDALEEQYDNIYLGQPRVSFDWCDAGYLIEAEGPQVVETSRHGLPWDVWV